MAKGENFIPTDRERLIVRGLSILGMNKQGIAELMEISVDTIDKHFKEETAIGKPQAIAAMAGKLYADGMAGNTTAQIFYLKTQGRWRERDEPLPPPPPGDRADGGAAAEAELPINPNAPRLGGLNLIGPTKRKPVTQIEAAPVKPSKMNGHTKK